MTSLDILWWVGWSYFAAWIALPLIGLPSLGTLPGLLLWALLAPWTALFGMASIHRLLPRSETGRFRMFTDEGSRHWALKGWAPSVYLTVFQPIFFLSPGFQRIVLCAFQAHIGEGTTVTSRSVIREPHHVRIGHSTLIGEFAHLICSYQPRPKTLIVADIEIGDDVLVGAYCHIGPGARIGSRTTLEYAVRVGTRTTVGEEVRIGAGTFIYNAVRIGNGVTVGKRCVIPSRSVIADGAWIPDGTVLPFRQSQRQRRLTA